jgi:hypothetical protein
MPRLGNRRQEAPAPRDLNGATARIKTLAEYLLKLTELGQGVSKGFDPNDMGQLMKFLHALQLQAQVLIDMVQRAAADVAGSVSDRGAAPCRVGCRLAAGL